MENVVLSKTDIALRKKAKAAKRHKVYALSYVYLILLLMYAPIVLICVFSFTGSKTLGTWTTTNFDAYASLFNPKNKYAQAIWSAAWNTAWVAVVSALCSTILGTLGAIGMHYLNKKLKTAFDFATQIPVVNAEIVMGLSLCILFVFCNWERSALTLIIGHMVLSIPFVVLNVEPRLEQMDPSLYEAALDLGATRGEAMLKVVLPDLLPGILSGFVLAITLSLDDYIITAFTKPTTGGFATISTYVEGVTAKNPLPVTLRAFTALLFAAILIVVVAFAIKTSRDAKKHK